MWWAIAANVGMNMLSAGQSYKADKAQYKASKAWQAYSNTMVRLSDAVNQNAITTNTLMAGDAFAEQALQIKRGSTMASAQVEVGAAAAGVKGRSVNQAMFDVQRNAAAREYERQQGFKNTMLAFDQQRLQSAMSAEMQQDYSYIPKPKAASYFLNAAAKSFDFASGFMGGGSGGSGGGASGSSIPNRNITGTRFILD
jgi:hypothetical protein